MISEERLRIIKSRLQEACGERLKGILLYGSAARGDSGPESDIDVLVLLEGPVDYGHDLKTCIHATYPLVLEWDRPISPEPVDVEEYEAERWPLYRNARREGAIA